MEAQQLNELEGLVVSPLNPDHRYLHGYHSGTTYNAIVIDTTKPVVPLKDILTGKSVESLVDKIITTDFETAKEFYFKYNHAYAKL